jgi:CRP/FNR family transcriptional regulator
VTVKARTALQRLLDAPESVGSAIRVSAGQFLFGPNMPQRNVYLVVEGLLRVIDPPDGGRRIPRTLEWLGPGDFVGWSAISPRLETRFQIRVERDSLLMPMSLRGLARRMTRQPRLALEIISQLVRRLNSVYVETGELVRLETPQRLANCLVRLTTNQALAQSDGRWTIIRLTHADLASRTGISRETVSLILSRWRRAGIVRTGRGRLMVDLARLTDAVVASPHGHLAAG